MGTHENIQMHTYSIRFKDFAYLLYRKSYLHSPSSIYDAIIANPNKTKTKGEIQQKKESIDL